MPDYLVTLNQPGQYSVGVDYEIPSKSIQYGNIVLDNLTGFNGIGVTFSLTDQGQSYVPNNNQQLIVSKNNLLLQPTADYTISGDKIIFTQPPASSDNVFMIALATAADLTRSVNYVIDSGSTPMLAGSGVIESIKVLSDQTGNVAFEISKSNFNDYPTFTTITGGNRVILSNSNKYFDDVLNNWDTSIVAGDILDFEVISVTGIRRFLISLKLKL